MLKALRHANCGSGPGRAAETRPGLRASPLTESIPRNQSAGRAQRFAERGILWTAAILVLWACYDQGAFLLPSKTIVAAVAPALGLLWILMRRGGGAGDHPSGRAGWGAEGWFFAGLAAFGSVSALWSLDWPSSIRAAGILFGGVAYLLLGRAVAAGSEEARASLLFLLCYAGILLSVISVVGWAVGGTPFALEQDGQRVLTGTFGYANAYAGFLLLTIMATVAVFMLRRPTGGFAAVSGRLGWRGVLMAAALAPQLVALVLTRARAALAVIVIALALCGVVRTLGARGVSRSRRAMGVGLVAALAVGAVVGGLMLWSQVAPQMAVSGLPRAVSGTGLDALARDTVPMTADAFRIKTWMAALHAFEAQPVVGHGLDSFYLAYAPYKLGAHTTYAHNIVIQHLVELGVVGTVLLLCFLGAALLPCVRVLRGSPADPRVPLVLGLVAFVLHNLVDLTWYFPALLFIFALVLGFVTSPVPTVDIPAAENETAL